MKINLKNIITACTMLALTGIFFSSCKKDVVDPTVDCSTSSSQNIEAFFNTIHASTNYDLYETMDLLTHEYTITTNVDIQVCGIGYKSQGVGLIYTMEILQGSTPLYSGNLSFSNTAFDYVSIPPVTLTAGTYTFRRTVTNNTNLNETIGPITRGAGNTSPTFPINLSADITIDSADFYGQGGPVPNYGVPNIYFEYVEL